MVNEDKFDVYEPDSSEWTWNNFYNRTYRTLEYWKNLNEEKRVGRYKKAIYTCKNLDQIYIGGDVMFNFKNSYGKSFRELLGNQYNEKAYSRMHHSILNFSLMPATGGLNLNKANGRYCDRLDRFIFYLDQFIKLKNENNPLLGIRGRNKNTIPILRTYTSNFDSIEEYCQAYYLIDSNNTNLVERLKKSGEEYVHNGATTENCRQYLNLASEFWKYRNEIFQKNYDIDTCSLDDGIDINFIEIDL